MKARRKGTNNPFKTVERIQLEDNDILYNVNVMEFEQDVITTHDTLSTELIKLSNQINEEKHWQEVRERAAIAAMQGTITILGSSDRYAFRDVAEFAVAYADALIEQLKKK